MGKPRPEDGWPNLGCWSSSGKGGGGKGGDDLEDWWWIGRVWWWPIVLLCWWDNALWGSVLVWCEPPVAWMLLWWGKVLVWCTRTLLPWSNMSSPAVLLDRVSGEGGAIKLYHYVIKYKIMLEMCKQYRYILITLLLWLQYKLICINVHMFSRFFQRFVTFFNFCSFPFVTLILGTF